MSKDIEKEGFFYIENGFKNKYFTVSVWDKFYNRNFLLKNNLFLKKEYYMKMLYLSQ